MTATQSPSDPSTEAVGDVVSRVRAAFDAGTTRSLEWRRRQLDGLVTLLETHEPALLAALAEDLGRPSMEGWFADIGPIAADVKLIRDKMPRWAAPRKVRLPMNAQPGRGEIRPEPLGVVLVIGAWNYPIQLVVEPLAAALAAGNAAVVKPSELAPATARLLTRLLEENLDRDAVAVVQGGAEVSTALLEQRFDHIFFTGSTRVGQLVMQAAARHLTPVTLELGGKSPCYVHSSADLSVAAQRVAWGKFFNAGQTCVAPDYVLVDGALAETFVDRVQGAVQRFYGLAPVDSPDFGRIVNDAHFARLQGLLDGQRVAFGGSSDAESRYFAPTAVLDPDPDSPLMTEEIFGPILPVVPVDGPQDAIAHVRRGPKPLAMYIFSTDDAVTEKVLDQTSSGGVSVNHVMLHAAPHCLPFGGVGGSGTGRYHGQSGFDTFSNLRSVLRKPAGLENTLLYPPYTRLQERIMKAAL